MHVKKHDRNYTQILKHLFDLPKLFLMAILNLNLSVRVLSEIQWLYLIYIYKIYIKYNKTSCNLVLKLFENIFILQIENKNPDINDVVFIRQLMQTMIRVIFIKQRIVSSVYIARDSTASISILVVH